MSGASEAVVLHALRYGQEVMSTHESEEAALRDALGMVEFNTAYPFRIVGPGVDLDREAITTWISGQDIPE